jgi:hypothetical protein
MNSYAVLQGPLVVFRAVASVQQATPTLARAAAKAVKSSEEYGRFLSLRQSLRGVYV